MKSRMLHRAPHVAFTWTAFVSWFLGFVMIQHRTRTFFANFLASTSSPTWMYQNTKSNLQRSWKLVTKNIEYDFWNRRKDKMLDFHTALRFQDLPDPLKIILMHDESRPMVLKLYHSAAKFHEKSSNTYLFSNNLSIISFFSLTQVSNWSCECHRSGYKTFF